MTSMTPITIRATDSVDLQMHTLYSDGSWAPESLMAHLGTHGFRVAAVTDHDTLEGLDTVVTAGAAHGVHVIPAVEVTTMWGPNKADLLCFAERFTGSDLPNLIAETRGRQLANTRDVHHELLRRGYVFPRRAEVLAARNGELTIPFDNIALLQAHGYAPTFKHALSVITDAGHCDISADLGAVIDAAHRSGAVALIAHPGRRERPFTCFDPALLDQVRVSLPLDGIEVWHPSHDARQVAEFEEYTALHGWLRSAGSDSHGPDRRLPIPYRAAQVRGLLERCGVLVTGEV